jgi:hypothetical protein
MTRLLARRLSVSRQRFLQWELSAESCVNCGLNCHAFVTIMPG